MATPNIVMTRIDERLVHGQGQLWVKLVLRQEKGLIK